MFTEGLGLVKFSQAVDAAVVDDLSSLTDSTFVFRGLGNLTSSQSMRGFT